MARGLRDEAADQPAGAAAPGGTEPLLDLDFLRGNAAALDLVSCVRPTPGTVEDSRGVWTVVPADTPRRTDMGLLIEEARTNWIRNNAMAGAAEGTPGDLPTHWSVTLPEGCAARVVETGTLDGIDYIDLGVSGEARGGSFAVAFEASGAVPAAAAQAWACSAFFQVVSDEGAARLSAPRLALSALTATGNEIEAGAVNLAPERFERAHVILRETPVGTTSLVPHLTAAQSWSGAVDFVVRIGWPQLELGSCPTSPIRTAGAKATRDADHLVAPLSIAGPCTIVAEFTAAFATAERQSERRVVWELRDGNSRACALAAGDTSAEGHPTLAMVDEHGRGVARSVRGFEAGALLRVGATLSSDVIESGCVALNGTPNSLLKGWLGGPDAALTLGRDASGHGYLCGTLRRLTVYPRALGISELMALTRPLAREGSLRGSRAHARPAPRRAPHPEVRVAPVPPPQAEAPAGASEDGGVLAAAARRLFAFRRRTAEPTPETPPLAPDEEGGVRPDASIDRLGVIAEDLAAGHEPERAAAAADSMAHGTPELAPDPVLEAARQQVLDLEARLAAEQARADGLERAHREEHGKFAAQIATLEAAFRSAHGSGQAAAESAARIAELEAALTSERTRADELGGRVQALEGRQAELEAELEAARRRASEAQMQAAVEQAARTRSAAEQARLERRIENLQAGIEEARALAAASARVAGEEAARAAEVEAGLKQEIEEARRHRSELEAALAAERALWMEHERCAEEERAEVQRRMAELDARAEEALSRAVGTAERLAAVEARRAELAQALEQAHGVASALANKAEAQEALRAELEQAHEAERARLLGDIAALESRAAAADERGAAFEARCAELAAALDDAKRSGPVEAAEAAAAQQARDDERDAHRRHVEDLERRLEEASSRASAGADRVAALDEAHAALAERLDQARLERAELAVRVEAGEAQRAALERGNAEARDALTQQLAALQLRVTEALSQAAAAAADLGALEEQRAALAASLDEARRRASEAQAAVHAEAALRHEREREHDAERRTGTEELARLRTRLEALLAAPAAAERPPAKPGVDEDRVVDSPVTAVNWTADADPTGPEGIAALQAEHPPVVSAEDKPRRSWTASAAILALVGAAAAIGALVVQADRGRSVPAVVAGSDPAPSGIAPSAP